MQVTIERQPGSKVMLTVVVEPAVMQEQMDKLFNKHARRVNVPGFRPGKAPRHMIEERLNRAALFQDAIEATIDVTYKQALIEQDIDPLERGEIVDVNPAEDNTLTYTVAVPVRPEVTLPDLSTIKVTKTVTQVTDAQVDTEIERLRERSAEFAEVTDSGIETGDYVTVDYTMTLDGEPYPDGDTTGYPLEVGSDTFFPELNDGLLGVQPEATTSVTTTYPSDYSNADLAGKTATFDITVQQVRRVIKPEVTDAWVEMISQEQLHTVEELRERVKMNLQVMASQGDHDGVRSALLRQVVDQSKLELPDTLVDEQYEHLMADLETRAGERHLSLEDLAEALGKTMADLENDQLLLARDSVRRSLVLQEIARRENLLITQDELTAVINQSAPDARAAKKLRADLEKSGQLDHLASQLFHEKVLTFLESQAEVVTVEGPAAVDATATTTEELPAKKKATRTKKTEAETAPEPTATEVTADTETEKPKKPRAKKEKKADGE